MSTQLEREFASCYARLPRERQEQVLEYGRWLRDNHVDLPDRLRSRCPRAETPAWAPSLHSELEHVLHGLDCVRQVLMEEYVLSLAEGRGTPGYVFLQFVGTIPEDALRQMEQVIEEEFEQIDDDAW